MSRYIICLLIILIFSVIYLFYLNTTENFNQLNTTYYIGPSKINGDGVFINTDIRQGTVLFEAIDKNKKVTKLGSKVNHCNNPNSALVEINNSWYLILTKHCNKNNEITADYNYTPNFIKKPDPSWTC